MNKLKASVIVPTYNRKKLLNYTLESLSKQTMNKEEYEIIICDDGSNDNTFELIRKYEKMMNIKYCYHTHDSFRVALTRNMGINIARGEICIFIDSGMIACTNFVEEHYKEHNKFENKCVVLGNILGFKTNVENENKLKLLCNLNDLDYSFKKISLKEEFRDEREITINHIGKDMRIWPAPWIYFWSGNISVRKDELEEVGLFDENYIGWGGEDTDLGIRLYLKGLRYVYSDNAQAIHYPHPQTSINKEEFQNRVIQRKKSLCKKYSSKVPEMKFWLQIGSTGLNNFLFDNVVIK